jgi:hypothetical protein
MTPANRRPSNVAASIHARLLQLARQSEHDFNALLVRFASERLLYRLSTSRHADRFVLKGALRTPGFASGSWRASIPA